MVSRLRVLIKVVKKVLFIVSKRDTIAREDYTKKAISKIGLQGSPMISANISLMLFAF